MYKITVFPGDGIGPEVIEQAVKVLKKLGQVFHLVFEMEEALVGGASIDRFDVPITEAALKAALGSDATFLGAVGGPKWDSVPAAQRPEKGLLRLRKELETFANLRPVKMSPHLVNRSPLKAEIVRGVNILIVRELVSGLYFGEPRGIVDLPGGGQKGFNTLVYTTAEVERVARKSFEFARKRKRQVTSVDKANVLESSQLWRKVVIEVHRSYPDVALNHRYVDDCAMQLIRDPAQFDVIVTSNMFGDILSDESAMLTGSIGMLPSASLGNEHGLYEPVHGSAPDIAGQDIGNPLAAILTVAMMLTYSFELSELAKVVEDAVDQTLASGYRTADIYEKGTQKVSCSKMGDLVVERIRA